MDDRAILEALDTSDGDFSGDEDEPEYLPPEVNEPSSSESEEEPSQPQVSHEEVTSRQFWLSKEMISRGPDITEDVLLSQGSSKSNCLYSFFEYLDLEFWKLVADQTNLYSAQTRDLRSVCTNHVEMFQFTGIQILMGTLKYPQARLYWSRELCVPLVKDTMTRDRFFELRNHLHFADNTATRVDGDKLWKIRPMLSNILKKCHSLPRSMHMSIDEQMVPFSGRCDYRQYVPSKPNPLGLKNFVLATRDGLVLDFEIYVGSCTIPQVDMAVLGLGAGVVKLLCRTVDKNCVLYTDRFFTSLKLANYLNENKNNVYLTGTVMSNRFGDVSKKLKTDKLLKRGEFDEKVRNDEKVCVVKWKDTKAVTMLSTCSGSAPMATCKRWVKTAKRKIDVPQPNVVKNYNTCMGGIDLCDRLIAYYRSAMRTKKWPVRAFSHFVDLSIVNCWIMYVRCCNQEGIEPKDKLGLLQYRLNVATAMARFSGGRVDPDFTSRPSISREEVDQPTVSTERNEGEPKKKYRAVVPLPNPEVRLDGVGHLPRFMDDKFPSKCRHPQCSSRCRTICTKCKIYLCVMKNNCFEMYHTYK
ncbi:piggyBac transposable element-derived protein 3-like [Hyposmocoma kahamanoa]|uniref:piggyBac transposable element-derived protein 3-like n=1 Tax=Hyposmocoma kahamanoa TaxID=1477025 RepID=UPI000E6D87A0|nr:piggyBac transposable element-derived protein 3-like [Hyposmocoma kahamanoa]